MKHRVISEQLTEQIRNGEFEAGTRLPADREIAAQFGVSYLTARRAVGALVEAELLERRIGDGTYVRDSSAQRLAADTLNLICSAYEGSNMSAFLRTCLAQCKTRNWNPHIFRIHPDHQQTATRAIRKGERSLVMAETDQFVGALGKAMQSPEARVVVVGNRMEQCGIPSVLADDRRAVFLAIEHLRRFGHENIALLGSNLEGDNQHVQVSAWCEALGQPENSAAARHNLIRVELPPFECAIAYAHAATRRWLESGQSNATALISLSDELAIGALAACHDCGLQVPEQMSIVNLNESALAAFARSPLTCVDVNLEAHAIAALEMLDALDKEGAAAKHRVCLIEPILVERQSVAPVVSVSKKAAAQ